MGEVYRGTDTKLGRDVALKVLPAEMAHDPERLARFRRESKALAQLDHPNIVTIHSFDGGIRRRSLPDDAVGRRAATRPLDPRRRATSRAGR
jgi:serine/threonine protein kinase